MNEKHRDEALTAQIRDVIDAARPSQFIPWITWILLIINTLVFLIETILAFSLQVYPTFWKWVLVSRDAQSLLNMMGALVPDTISQPWRVVTALFLHVGLVHYALSMLGLWTFRRVEHSIGRWGYLVIYFSGVYAMMHSTHLLTTTQPAWPGNVKKILPIIGPKKPVSSGLPAHSHQRAATGQPGKGPINIFQVVRVAS